MNTIDRITSIFNLIEEISHDDIGISEILADNMMMAIALIKILSEKDGDMDNIDISEQIQMVSSVLGISLEELITHIVNSSDAIDINKEADEETMEFITNTVDTDDYEKFLKQNKVLDSLKILSKEI